MGRNALTGSACRRRVLAEELENPTGRRNCKSKKMGRIVGLVYHFKSCVSQTEPQGELKHEASVWQIILPEYVAGVCHYAQCDWLRQLSGQVIPSREVALRKFPVKKAR